MISLPPYEPTEKTKFWCEKCDCNIVNSENKETGSFFVVFGHCYQAGSRQYDGPFNGVMFAWCNDCMNGTTKFHECLNA